MVHAARHQVSRTSARRGGGPLPVLRVLPVLLVVLAPLGCELTDYARSVDFRVENAPADLRVAFFQVQRDACGGVEAPCLPPLLEDAVEVSSARSGEAGTCVGPTAPATPFQDLGSSTSGTLELPVGLATGDEKDQIHLSLVAFDDLDADGALSTETEACVAATRLGDDGVARQLLVILPLSSSDTYAVEEEVVRPFQQSTVLAAPRFQWSFAFPAAGTP